MSSEFPVLIRPFLPSDYDRLVEINGLLFPQHPETVEEVRHNDDSRDAKFQFQRYAAETETGTVVAIAEYSQGPWQFHPRKFYVHVKVHPEFQRKGIGSRLYLHLLSELAKFEPIKLRTSTQEDKPAALAFLHKYSFTESMREWESCLDPSTVDLSLFSEAVGKVEAEGIVLKTIRELETDPDRNRKMYDLESQISLDMPSSEASSVPTFADWKQHTLHNPGLLPDGFFIAVDTRENNRYVGVSQLFASKADDQLYTGATGVLPTYRRRGIALALKIRAITYAREKGTPLVRTWNAQSNRAMLSINEKIGFIKEPAWIEFHRSLRPEPITIRQATPRDYEVIAQVHNSVWPEFPETAEEFREYDLRRSDKVHHARFLVEQEGRVIGLGEYDQDSSSYDPHRFILSINVIPDFQNQGFGKALYEHLLAALRPYRPNSLMTFTLADRERAVRFFSDRGFEISQREQTGKWDPSQFDSSLYSADLEKVVMQGIMIRSFADLRDLDPDIYTKYESLHWHVKQDIPHPEEPTRLPMDEFMKRFESTRFLPEANFIAVDDATGDYVGITMLYSSASNSDLHTGMTGVLRDYRNRGIATALKIRALSFAKERRATAVWTTNEVGNIGMLGINKRFGFERQPDELILTKKLEVND